MDNKDVSGKDLKKARHVQDMTQEEVATLLGINRCYLSLIENERVTPGTKLQEKINHYFKDIVDSFFFLT